MLKKSESLKNTAIEDVFAVARDLLSSLETTVRPRNREIETEQTRERTAKRFGPRDEATA